MLWFILSLTSAFSQATRNAYNKKLVKNTGVYLLPGATAFFAAILFLAHTLLITGIPDISEELWVWVFITAFVVYIANVFLFKALETTEFSILFPVLSLTPLFSFITAYLVLGETATIMDFIAVFLIIGGIYITTTKSHNIVYILKNEKGVSFVFITAFLYSITSVGGKKLLIESNESFGFSMMLFMFSAFMIISAYIAGELKNIRKLLASSEFPKIVVLNYIENISANYAFMFSNVVYVIAIKRLSVLFSLIYAKYFFHEKRLLKSLIGTIMIIIGTVLLLI